MQRTSFAQMQCSLARGLELIGDWWSPLIIRDLYLNAPASTISLPTSGYPAIFWRGA